jgi:glycolate oxidase
LEVSRRLRRHGLYYAPDPSSQPACTVGGNIAENSGGPHTLKYGVTLNHVEELELVLPDGEVVRLDRSSRATGYDLAGLTIGSEGTFGIVTAGVLRLMVIPQARLTLLAVFATVLDASRAVSAIIAAGIVPAALEMMDHLIIEAVEAAYGFGFPPNAGAVLIIELDGLAAGLDELHWARRRSLPAAWSGRSTPGGERSGTRAAVEVTQARVRGHGTVGSELLHAGRRRST